MVATINNMIIGGLTAYEIEMYKNETSEMFLFEIDVDENYRQRQVGIGDIESILFNYFL